jgi:hypothetical protein
MAVAATRSEPQPAVGKAADIETPAVKSPDAKAPDAKTADKKTGQAPVQVSGRADIKPADIKPSEPVAPAPGQTSAPGSPATLAPVIATAATGGAGLDFDLENALAEALDMAPLAAPAAVSPSSLATPSRPVEPSRPDEPESPGTAPAARPGEPDPFSLNSIEAEFARLLGRSPEPPAKG